jgi:microcystin-dependent protein
VGEIRLGGWNYAPADWALCQGQLLPIEQNQALFNLIGTTYGGDGVSTFALPDLRGRVPLHRGSGFAQGQLGGEEQLTLTGNQMPVHNHQFLASTDPGAQRNPTGNVPATVPAGSAYVQNSATAALAPQSISATTTSGLPHDNMQPYLGLTFIISLAGIYPSQS